MNWYKLLRGKVGKTNAHSEEKIKRKKKKRRGSCESGERKIQTTERKMEVNMRPSLRQRYLMSEEMREER